MANKIEIQFKKGDQITHYFQIPADSWSAGGSLSFAAKAQPDDDATDALAVIDKSFDDTAIVDPSHEMYDAAFVTYELTFDPGDVNVSFSDNSKKKKFLGEFQFVPDTGEPETFPGDDDFLEVIVFADIKRGTS